MANPSRSKAVGDQRRYTRQEKRAALTAYLTTGCLTAAANLVDIPRARLYNWSKTKWWADWTPEIQAALDKKTVAMMRGNIELALAEIRDRLENGDERIIAKTGEIERVKVLARDLIALATPQIDRVRVAEGKATTISESRNLLDTAEIFEQIADRYMKRVSQMSGQRPVIEGEVVRLAGQLPGDR